MQYFNPRAPCGARRVQHTYLINKNKDFNPRAPCGARQFKLSLEFLRVSISTHAPLAGRDRRYSAYKRTPQGFQPTRPLRGATLLCFGAVVLRIFQPTRPLRGATPAPEQPAQNITISTHAPLAGRDSSHPLSLLYRYDFNPRAPCGARQQKCTNHYAHFCDNRQISDAFTQNAACQGILLLFDAGKPCGFWVRTAQVISAHLCFAL